jgi:replicative DNA helicase
MNVDLGKVPPQNQGIEQKIIGILLTHADAFGRISGKIKAEYFYKDEHKLIYEAIADLHYRNITPEIVLVAHELARKHKLEAIGGPYYLTECTGMGIRDTNLELYVQLITELWLRRQAIMLCHQTSEHAYNEEYDIFDTLDILQIQLDKLDIRLDFKESNTQTVLAVQERIRNVQQGAEEAYMMFSQFKLAQSLKITKRRIYLLGASKKIGKTKFMIWLIRQLMSKYPIALSWHTYEMDKDDIILELVSEITRIPVAKLMKERKDKDILTATEKAATDEAFKLIASWNIDWTTSRQTIEKTKIDFRVFSKKHPGSIPVLIIDNFGGILKSFPKKSQTENEDHIADEFMSIRDQTKGILFIIHHLNKEVMLADNHESGYMPMTEHFRGTGRLTDYANMVILLHRPGHFPDIVDEEYEARADLIEQINGHDWHPIDNLFLVILAETRHGKETMIRCMCDLTINSFVEWENPKARITR